MITGHFGIAALVLAASRLRTPPILFVAVMIAAVTPDAVDVVLALMRVCSPFGLYSHTINSLVLQVAVISGAAWLATGSRTVAMLFAVPMLLHIPADWFTGSKLIVAGGELHGLRLYQRPLIDFLIEVPIAVAGWWALRGRAGIPPRAVAASTLRSLILVQLAFMVYGAGPWRSLKPSGCVDAPSPRTAQVRPVVTESHLAG